MVQQPPHDRPNFRFLYLSRLSPGLDFSAHKPIVHAARRYNPVAGIHGAMLFDGERFCQLLEGPAAVTQTLAGRIAADARHRDIVRLDEARFDGPASLPGWRSGYCASEDLDAFERPEAPRGPRATALFLEIVDRADMLG